MIFTLMIISFLFGYAISTKFKNDKSNYGERLVTKSLESNFPYENYHLLNNITLSTEDGGTTQIDHILITQYGVFVIETKDYSGWVFGSKERRNWTQSFPSRKYSFQNPLHQNIKHVNELKNLFDFLPSSAFKSVVVFTNRSTFKTTMPDNVLKIDDLEGYINSFQMELISLNRIFFLVGKIEVLRHDVSEITDMLHIQYLKEKYNPVSRCLKNKRC